MRVLVIGEGPHDIGVRDHWCARTKAYVELPGWLQELLKKFTGPDDVIAITALRSRDIVLTDRLRRQNMPLPEGHGAKALAAMFKAKSEGFDLLVFMADTDSKDDREWDRHHTCIREGFSKIPGGPFAVACLPKSASESWLLSDETAWTTLGLPNLSDLPTRPEDLSGERNDPKGNHPHRIFARICEQAGVSDSRETRVEVAKGSTLSVVARKCPKSFVAFWKELAAAGGVIPPQS
jgi:hypothetical protein